MSFRSSWDGRRLGNSWLRLWNSRLRWSDWRVGSLPVAAPAVLSCGLFACVLAGMLVGMTGCGTPAAPQPPSLKLPVPVSNLTAERAGETVTVRWTTTKKTTDHLLIEGAVQARVCRVKAGSAAKAENCQAAGEVSGRPGAASEFQDRLPAELVSGEPRVLRYFVELRNAHGKSAGFSNPAAILAGAAPEAVDGLSAEVRADGVALRWQASGTTAIRLHRTLLTPQSKPAKKDRKEKSDDQGKGSDSGKGNDPIAQPSEPVERTLWVNVPASGTFVGSLDSSAHFGESYAYRAQRVARVTVDGQTLELGGPLSEAVRVDVIDRFPPAVPRDLAAVAVAEEKSIDLSWTPDTDADLAGYIVYRHDEGDDAGGQERGWERISSAQPVIAAAWRDTAAEPGHGYRYRVTAIDQTGHESAPSNEARETLPKL